MVKSIFLGSAFFLGLHVFHVVVGSDIAFSCNRTAGCAMDNMLENYDMMHSNKMKDAMTAGKENIEAFRRLQEAERKRSGSLGTGAGKPKL
ncbi:hypothetical protein [Bosea sp. CRIB-10]|uniref:hypothetical protein n=1 Tax=Bosea sp. CRIB-10 TaxID=378404 RepID=UPI001113F45C|nr:hypothetical protein [Bosea sp. CRIB-10]